MPKVLITGFNGFVGQHCAREFRARGFETIGLTDKQITDEQVLSSVDQTVVCDLLDPDSVSALILDGLTSVLNLAGIATNSGGDPELIKKLNVDVHMNLYRHLISLSLNPRIIAVSSGAVYDPNQDMPETEDSRLKNANAARPYEASKILMEQFIKQEFGTRIIIARPFNHIGPGQKPGFIVTDLALQITQAMNEKRKSLQTGNLSTMRDYTDVRDVARAYADLLEAPQLKHSVYNICSGQVRSGEEILALLIEGLGAPSSYVPMQDTTKLREGDANMIVGSSARIRSELGWAPSIAIEDTITDFCEWYKSS